LPNEAAAGAIWMARQSGSPADPLSVARLHLTLIMKKPLKHPPQKEKSDKGEDLIWGFNPVREALQHHPRNVSEVLMQRGKAGPRYQEIIELCRENRVRLRFVPQERLGVSSQSSHQGVVARQGEVAFLPMEELLERELASPAAVLPRILVLDSIQDPRNLGAVFRSALAAGFTSIVVSRERSAPISGTVASTSAGAVSRLAISQAVNLTEALQKIKQQGFWVFGAVPDPSALSVYQVDLAVPLCLVIGSEAKGIRPLVRKQCDQLITIPMQGGFDSLNVSVAAAVIMFEAVRQQRTI
jgi:23S rRNA (guanosine2251-2'-O)-methyltransferase